MAKVYVLDFAGGTAAHYDALVAEVDRGGVLPPGARFHSAGPSPTGFRVIDCWDDPHGFPRFAAEVLRPAAAKAGLQSPHVQALDVDDIVTGRIRRPEVAMFGRLPGVDRATYRALDAKVRRLDEVPEGLVQHVNGPYDGGWFVVDLWATEMQRARFLAQRVAPNIPPGAPAPVYEVLPVHNAMVERARTRA